MKKILVPTDFSPVANNGIAQAVKIAKTLNASVTVLHCMDLANQYSDEGLGAPYLNSFNTFFSDLKKDTENKLTKIKNTYKDQVEIQAIYLEGNPKYQLADYANDNWYNMIVMGTEGSDGLSEVLFGSVAEKVVRRALCPVLSIGKNNTDVKLDNLALVSDFTENTSTGYAKMTDTIKDLHSNLFLVRINTPFNFESTSYVNRIMDDFALKNQISMYEKIQYNHERFEVGVYEVAKDNNIDVVVIGTHGRSGITHLFKNSVAEDVVNHLDLPILTFNI